MSPHHRLAELPIWLELHDIYSQDPAVTESELIAKLEKVERLFAGAASDGERLAALEAKARLTERLNQTIQREEPEEYKFSMNDSWSRKLFIALLRRYGLKPFRYKRQRYTTVMARVPKSFVDKVLWPEFMELSEVLDQYLNSITDRVIQNHIHAEDSDADVIEESPQLAL